MWPRHCVQVEPFFFAWFAPTNDWSPICSAAGINWSDRNLHCCRHKGKKWFELILCIIAEYQTTFCLLPRTSNLSITLIMLHVPQQILKYTNDDIVPHFNYLTWLLKLLRPSFYPKKLRNLGELSCTRTWKSIPRLAWSTRLQFPCLYICICIFCIFLYFFVFVSTAGALVVITV